MCTNHSNHTNHAQVQHILQCHAFFRGVTTQAETLAPWWEQKEKISQNSWKLAKKWEHATELQMTSTVRNLNSIPKLTRDHSCVTLPDSKACSKHFISITKIWCWCSWITSGMLFFERSKGFLPQCTHNTHIHMPQNTVNMLKWTIEIVNHQWLIWTGVVIRLRIGDAKISCFPWQS